MDLTGLDVTAAVIDSIWEGFRYEARLRPSFLTPNRVVAGLHGRKTGRGWYAYGDGVSGPAPESAVTGDAERPVFLVPGGRPETAAYEEALAGSLEAAGVRVERGAGPSGRAVVLVPVWGTPVSAAVAAGGWPRERTFGVEVL